MTPQDIELIAAAIKGRRPAFPDRLMAICIGDAEHDPAAFVAGIDEACEAVCVAIMRADPNFDSAEFLAQCGVRT